MRNIATLIALFSIAAAFGQAAAPYTPQAGDSEPARSRTIPLKSFEAGEDNPYVRVVEWQREGEAVQPDGTRGLRYTARCSVPFAWANRQVLLRVAEAPAGYELTVNGQAAGRTQSGALPAEFNVTKQIAEGGNRLELFIPTPAVGAPLEDFAGAAPAAPGRTELLSQPTIRIRDCVVTTRQIDGDHFLGEVGIVVKCDALNPKQARIYYDLSDPEGKSVKSGFEEIELAMRREDTLRFVVALDRSELWSPASPRLYTLRLRTMTEGRYTEYLTLPAGFRSIGKSDGVLHLNGEPFEMELRMLTERPTYALLSALKPPKAVEPEPVKGKKRSKKSEPAAPVVAPEPEGPAIVVWAAPGVLDEQVYDWCDELGIGIVAQAPLRSAASGLARTKGGNPTNDPAWRAACIERAERAWHLAKRHPSVIALSIARDAANGIGLYESYLHMKGLEPALPILYPEAAGEWNNDGL